MAYKMITTVQGRETYASLIGYLRDTLENDTAVRNFIAGIKKTLSYLEENPYLYEECSSLRLKSLGYRRAVSGKYIIIYRVSEEEHTVYVAGFFHGYRNYETLL